MSETAQVHHSKSSATQSKKKNQESLFKTIKEVINDKNTCHIADHSWVQYVRRVLLPTLPKEEKRVLIDILNKYKNRENLIKFEQKELWDCIENKIKEELRSCVEFVHHTNSSSAKSIMDHKWQKATYFGNTKNKHIFVVANNVLLTVHSNESCRWTVKT